MRKYFREFTHLTHEQGYLGSAEKLPKTTKWLNVNNHPENSGWDEIAPLKRALKGFNIN